jgi:hypothetical protein
MSLARSHLRPAGFSILISPSSMFAPGVTTNSLRTCGPTPCRELERSMIRYLAPGIRAGKAIRPWASETGLLP